MPLDTLQLKSEILQSGYCLIEDVISQTEIPHIRDEIQRDVWAHNVLDSPTGYVPGFLRFNQSLAPYLADAKIMAVMESVFGPHVRISMLTGSVNAPGLPRGSLHSDWPFNQKSQAHIPAPYPDTLIHVVTFWMLTDFTIPNGATILIPQSHKRDSNPSAGHIDPSEAQPGPDQPSEVRLIGKAGSVALVDARMWHAEAPNVSDHKRVAVIARYAPWWLNLDPLRPGTIDHQDIVESNNGMDSRVPALPEDVYHRLPDNVKPLLRYSVAWKQSPFR